MTDTAITIQNPNDPDYWKRVQENARLRNALQEVKAKHKSLRIPQVYEAYVSNVLDLVKEAATKFKVSNNADEYIRFKSQCASELGLPEIVELTEREVRVQSEEATADAFTALYGDEF